jgi:site-specific DNA-methyltransferase (adenine-specific)
MVTIPDNFFDIAIVDPPYGIGENWKKDQFSKFYKHQSTYKNNSIPGRDYFNELFRISKNQIIWGGNYYTEHLCPRHSWITWNKFRDYEKQHMAEGELAWTSFNVPLRIYYGAVAVLASLATVYIRMRNLFVFTSGC